jgi:hypothetical protein
LPVLKYGVTFTPVKVAEVAVVAVGVGREIETELALRHLYSYDVAPIFACQFSVNPL